MDDWLGGNWAIGVSLCPSRLMILHKCKHFLSYAVYAVMDHI